MMIEVDYVAELYECGEISIREAAEILQLNFRQTNGNSREKGWRERGT